MGAVNKDITIEQGATFNLNITWQDNYGIPIDLNGYTAKMQIRPDVYSTVILLELSTTNDRITLVPGAGSGLIELNIPASVTTTLVPGDAVYDLKLINSGGTTRLLQGLVTISPQVTL